jgi:hypothetical protein
MQRGRPIRAGGTEYLREPQHGEIVRSAMWLGLIVVSCGSAATPPQRAKPNRLNISIKETWPKTLKLVCASAEWQKITLCA